MGPSPAGDHAGCPGGLAERSAAPTEASLACVSHWKTAPVPSRRPTVAGRSRPWSCVCSRPLQDHGDRARGDPALAPPPRVPQRGIASTPPRAQRHPRPHTPHAAPVRPLTIPVPMLLSGRPTRSVCAAASAGAVEHPSVLDLAWCTVPRGASEPVARRRSVVTQETSPRACGPTGARS